jgi:uncharacterized iron-regulated membrane protein
MAGSTIGRWSKWPAVRGWIMKIHLWTALTLCLPLAVLGLTGSLLVFEDELAGLSAARAEASRGGPPQPIAKVLAAARSAAPAGLRPMLYLAPDGPGAPAEVRFAPPGQGRPGPGGATVSVDPGTLNVLSVQQTGGGFLRTMFLLHANAMMKPPMGRAVIGWLGVAMMTLAVTGLVIWWPRGGRWRAAFRVRRGARGARLHRDLHGAVGIWTLPVFLVVGFTGIYLGFPRPIGDAVSAVLPARDLRGAAAAIKVAPIAGRMPADIDRVAALALARVPSGALLSIRLPARPDQPYRVAVAPPGHRRGAPPVTAFVDPWRLSVVGLQDPATFTPGETVIAWQHALHAGAGLGPLWRGAVFVSGLLPSLFGVTGVALWWLRRRRRKSVRAEAT